MASESATRFEAVDNRPPDDLSEVQALWGLACEGLRSKLNRHTFQTYFAPIRAVGGDGASITLAHTNNFMIDWVRDNYADILGEELRRHRGNPVGVKFVITDSPAAPTADAAEPSATSRIAFVAPAAPRGPGIASGLNEKYTFDTFVVGPSNQFAVAACNAVANAPGKAYNPLYLFGGVGLGKTHLVHAIGNAAREKEQSRNVVYLSSEAFTNDLIHSLELHKMPEFRARYRERCDVLLLDDIQFLAKKTSTMEEFFHTFNVLHEAGKQIVVTSDKLPQEIEGFEERLRSRFQWGLIADIQPPEVETRVAILKKKASLDGIPLPDDVALYLGANIRSNVRELEGSLIRLAAFASLTHAPITVELARDVLKNVLVSRGDRPDLEAVIRTVAEHYGIKPADIKGDRRHQPTARARQVAMYLARKLCGLSTPQLGEKFDRDHSTIIAATQKIDEVMAEDPDFRQVIATLERRITQ